LAKRDLCEFETEEKGREESNAKGISGRRGGQILTRRGTTSLQTKFAAAKRLLTSLHENFTASH